MSNQGYERALVEKYLLDQGTLAQPDLGRVERLSNESGVPFLVALSQLGLVEETRVAEDVATALGLCSIDRVDAPEPIIFDTGVSFLFLRARRVVPLAVCADVVRIAMADPLDEEAERAMRFAYGRPVERVVAPVGAIEDALLALGGEQSSGREIDADADELIASLDQEQDDAGRLEDLASDAPTIKLVNRLIANAVVRRASDIHIEPQPRAVVIRYRIDGSLVEAERLSDRWTGPIASRIKVMARLDIAESRLPQDGRIRATVQGREIDVRVATAPAMHGEALVLRILGRSEISHELGRLGLPAPVLGALTAALARPNGIILLTGPTGSGKTTTLYAALNRLRRPDVKILTAEDPIEYVIPGINQVQVKPEIGLTYAAVLRSFLRHDPNVLMVGEIRDEETADIATHFAMVGRLVLSTLHTNSAVGAITRLLEMGVEPFVLSSVLRLCVAQRLVRKLCPECATRRPMEATELRVFADAGIALQPDAVLRDAVGCPVCEGTGFRGRQLIAEAVDIGPAMRGLIRDRAPESAYEAAMVDLGTPTLLRHGLELVNDGITSFSEIVSAVDTALETA